MFIHRLENRNLFILQVLSKMRFNNSDSSFLLLQPYPVSGMRSSLNRILTIYCRIYRSIQKTLRISYHVDGESQNKYHVCACGSLYTLNQMPKAIAINWQEGKKLHRISFRNSFKRDASCVQNHKSESNNANLFESDYAYCDAANSQTNPHKHTHVYFFDSICSTGRLSMRKPSRHCTQDSWIYFYSRFIRNLCDQL